MQTPEVENGGKRNAPVSTIRYMAGLAVRGIGNALYILSVIVDPFWPAYNGGIADTVFMWRFFPENAHLRLAYGVLTAAPIPLPASIAALAAMYGYTFYEAVANNVFDSKFAAMCAAGFVSERIVQRIPVIGTLLSFARPVVFYQFTSPIFITVTVPSIALSAVLLYLSRRQKAM